jgi:anaerobic magnesium-protoporphyrin IX monomethyl ester cyclase
MRVALLDVVKPGDNKDFNGGFGTTFNIGESVKSKLLAFARGSLENLPTFSYAYNAGIFKKYGHKVNYYMNKTPDSSDIILIHVSMIRHNEELGYIRKMKKMKIGKIGVYGPIATVMPQLFREADFVIAGEPEEAIINIARTKKIPCGIVKTKPIMDLDILPFPDWSIFPIETYSLSPSVEEKPAVFVHASRGCPYGCSYCPYLVFGTYRARKPEKVIEELIHLKKTYGIKGFFFRDPTFSINSERIEKLCNLMIKNRLNLKWGCETRTNLLNPKLLNLMHEAGLRAIKVGVESTDLEMLKRNGRTPPEKLHQEKVLDFCKKKGIKVIAFYIIGLPSDTKKNIENTIKYSRKLNTAFANFTIFTPIPGTPYFNNIKDKIFDSNFNNYDNFHVVFKHDFLTKEELMKLHEEAITGYYFRTRYILSYIKEKLR